MDAKRLKYVLLVGVFSVLMLAFQSAKPVRASTTYVVNSTDDVYDGSCDATHCSLREAIIFSNTLSGHDYITFDVGTATIMPGSELPPLADPAGVTIEGEGTITLNGQNAGFANGLVIQSSYNTIQGLTIRNFAFIGIMIEGVTNNPDAVSHNVIGKLSAGPYMTERNVIRNNGDHGIWMKYSSYNIIAGNYIGTSNNGSTAQPNQGEGITMSYGSDNRIGTDGNAVSDDTERNIIVTNGGTGIEFDHQTNMIIAGNYVGLNAAGTQILGSGWMGMDGFLSDDLRIGTDGDDFVDDLERNVIAGYDIGMVLQASNNVTIKGNHIGTDAAGMNQRANAEGIRIYGGSNIQIGTTLQYGPVGGYYVKEAERNVISGNDSHGIYLADYFDHELEGVYIWGNRIGVGKDGVKPLGNGGDGVFVDATGNKVDEALNDIFIGTAGPTNQGNIIAHNGESGVEIKSYPDLYPLYGRAVHVVGNAIFDNGELGIDISDGGLAGVNPNDSGDADTGSNDLLNYPNILSATAFGSAFTTVRVEVDAEPNTYVTLNFYANESCDPSGYGEGQTYLGVSPAIVTDSTGKAVVILTLPQPVPVGQFITATTDSLAVGTSEFSACMEVTPLKVVFLPGWLAAMQSTVDNLVDQRLLDAREAAALQETLTSALAYVERGDLGSAVRVMETFTRQVNELVDSEGLPAVWGDHLIATTDAIISLLKEG